MEEGRTSLKKRKRVTDEKDDKSKSFGSFYPEDLFI